jgi:predicted nicotinamide N-methyase
MEAMASLITADMPSEADSAQQKAFVTYSYPHHSTDDSISHDRTVTLLEARSVISSSGTTGLRTWEAALLLGSYLASETGRASIQGKRLFELGAGTGMLSILCAKHLGVAGVVATDGDEAVVDAIETNLFLNGLDTTDTSGCQVRTAALKWGYRVDATTFSEDYGMEVPDVVVGADVVSYRHYVVVEMWVNSVADL